jgi:predicted RNA-binding protein YlqC (UPF0109 family)
MTMDKKELQRSEETFTRMTSLLGLQATATAVGEEQRIVLKVETEEPGRLIGRRGKTLRAIQYLMNLLLQRDQEQAPKIYIGVNDDGKERPARKTNDSKKSEQNNDRKQDQKQPAAKADAQPTGADGDTPDEDAAPRKRRRRRGGRGRRRRGGGGQQQNNDGQAEQADQAAQDKPAEKADVPQEKPKAEPKPAAKSEQSDQKRGQSRNQSRGNRSRGSSSGRDRSREQRAEKKKKVPELKPMHLDDAAVSKAIKQVKRWGEAVTLLAEDPGNCAEACNIVNDDPEVQGMVTDSEFRRLVIELR